MADIITCSRCSTRLKIETEWRGKEIRCPRCEYLVQVPDVETAERGEPQSGHSENEPGSPESQPDQIVGSTSQSAPPAFEDRHDAAIKIDPHLSGNDEQRPGSDMQLTGKAEERFLEDHENRVDSPQPANAASTPVRVSEFVEDPNLRWLLRVPEQVQFGPVASDILDRWVEEGRVSSECQIREQHDPHWQPATVRYPILDDAGNPFASVAQTEIARNLPSHRGGLLLSLALIGCLVPFVSIVAATLGTQDLRLMQNQKLDTRGEGLTRSAQVIATTASLIWLAAVGLTLLYLLVRLVR